MKGQPRTYRRTIEPAGLRTFQIRVKETDLLIGHREVDSGPDLEDLARTAVLDQRRYIEEMIARFPVFLTALKPWLPPQGPGADFLPGIIGRMLAAGRLAGTGPMAAVAGAVAEQVGRALLKHSTEVIVENGGDLFLAAERRLRVALEAGDSPLSGKLGLVIEPEVQPLGVSTSSGTVGHSLSLGKADSATVLARDAALADALATSLGNRVRTKAEIGPALEWLGKVKGALGGVVIIGGEMGAWGRVEVFGR